MKNINSDKIIKNLQQLPELEPPSDIVDNVMQRVKKTKTGWLTSSIQFLLRPRPVSFRPVQLIVGACALLVFGYLVPFNQSDKSNIDIRPPKNDIFSQAMQDTRASFLMGQGLMAAGLAEEALPLLQNASLSAPDNPEYAFWAGLCFSANDMPEEERSSYRRAIESSPKSATLLLNLGHSFLEERKYDEALVYYNQVLSLDTTEQTALYNKALIFHLQQKQRDEQAAWKAYLDQYRYGINAFRAVQHLNNLNDFTYRIYDISKLRIILNQEELLSMSPLQTLSYNTDKLSRYLSQNPSLHLDIVIYHTQSALAAKQKAVQLKQHLVTQLGQGFKHRIRLSWFGEQETVQTQTGTKNLSESVLIFATNRDHLQQETTI